MTDIIQPADELRAAAAKIRDIAGPTTPGPWTDRSTDDTGAWPIMIVGGDDSPGDGRGEPVLIVHESVTEEIVAREDATWIALAGPQIAEPLAAWLEGAADDLGGAEEYLARTAPGETFDPFEYVDEPGSVRAALRVARAINGGAQ